MRRGLAAACRPFRSWAGAAPRTCLKAPFRYKQGSEVTAEFPQGV